MSNPNAYVQEINSLKAEIKRLNMYIKGLREQKKQKEGYLYNYMKKHQITKFEGITIKSITPRTPIKRKSESQKRQDAIDLFKMTGIPNPEEFWKQFKGTQKYNNRIQTNMISTSNGNYDPYLSLYG